MEADQSSEYGILLQTFAEEARDHLESMVELLVKINLQHIEPSAIHSLFRSLHTLKGCSRSLSLTEIGVLSHAAEELLDSIRENRVTLTVSMVDHLLKVMDLLSKMVSLALVGGTLASEKAEVDDAVALLKSFLSGSSASQAATPVQAAFGFFDEEEKTAAPSPVIPSEALESTSAQKQDKSIRIRHEKIEDYVNLASELMIARNALLHHLSMNRQTEDDAKKIRHAAQTLDRLTTEIHHNAMGMRMVPVKHIFQKAPRIVRDISRSLGKEIELATSGDDVEIDRQVAEGLTDPLLHLIRNCVDHGIEPIAERQRVGKDSSGKILLRASQKGGTVWIEVVDDGQGIHCDRLKAKALEKGLITAAEQQAMSDEDALQLIFRQGLSTAAVVSDISGRGVGMDVVKSNVLKMGGQVHVHSRPQLGTTIRIELPLSLSVMNALIVESAAQVYALPSDAIQELVKVPASALHDVRGVPTFLLRDQLIPCYTLESLVNKPGNEKAPAQDLDVVVVKTNSDIYGVRVERLQNRQEIVVKPLPQGLGSSSCFGGAAILGNGSVVLVIEPIGLVRAFQTTTEDWKSAQTTANDPHARKDPR